MDLHTSSMSLNIRAYVQIACADFQWFDLLNHLCFLTSH